MRFTALRVFLARLLGVLRARQREERLEDEINAHLEALAADYVARGWPEADARLAARRSFGGVDRMAMLYREQHGLPVVQWFWFDIRSAWRVLTRDRWFTSGVILVLAMGLTVNTAIFTIVNGMTWRTLPVHRGDRIVQVASQRLQGRREGLPTSYADFRDWQSAVQTLSGVAAYAAGAMNAGDDMRPADRLAGNFVSSNAFSVLGVAPLIGRDFGAADDAPGSLPVVLLAHHVWVSRYAGDRQMVGRTIRLNGIPTMVIGVMPPGFQFPIRADLWRPLGQMPGLDMADRGQRRLAIFGRLRDQTTIEEARAEMDAIARALAAEHPATNRDVGARTVFFTHAFVAPPPEAREPLVMMIAAAVVLLIACADGANLLLARAASRAREIALRATLGASRFRLVRQLLVEALLMAAAAGAIGLAFSLLAVQAFTRETADANLPFWIAFEFDVRVFTFVAVVCLGTAIAFGLAPAWQLSRTDTTEVLKDGGRGSLGSVRSRRWTAALLVSELALTVMLLGAGAVLVRRSAEFGAEDALVDLDSLFAADIALPASRYDSPAARQALLRRLHERLTTAAEPLTTALSTARPFVGSSTHDLLFEGEPRAQARPVQSLGVTDNYFETLGLALLRGRALRAEDAAAGQEAVVINESFAQAYFARADPVGQRIRLLEPGGTAGQAESWFTIVGVTPSIRQRTMGRTAPVVYLPLDIHPSRSLTVIARAADNQPRTVANLREEVRAIDRDLAVFNVASARRLSQLSRWPARFVSLVLALFAVVASVLSAGGLYGMTAYSVTQRTAEFGLRMALGAQPAQLAWALLRASCVHILLGVTIGLAGAFAAAQVLHAVLVPSQSPAVDAWVLMGVAILLVIVVAAACLVPARRAVRLDPVAALRRE